MPTTGIVKSKWTPETASCRRLSESAIQNYEAGLSTEV
jgi:hypothetical protein